jgi:UDP-N-acetylmuramyl pentapeptide synthase
VAPAHLGGFASLDDIEHAKGEILSGMAADAVFVANADDPRSLSISRRHRGPVLRYGLSGEPGLDAAAREVAEEAGTTRFVLTLRGKSAPVLLPLPGRHNVSNFLAAAAASSVLGVTAEEAAAAAGGLRPARHRGEVSLLPDGVLLYDDSYNSSPAALRAAWAAFLGAAGARRKVAVVGEMLELGRKSRDLHFEAGRELAGHFDLLVAVRGDASALAEGALSGGRGAAVVYAEDARAAESAVRARLEPGDAIFVKGSRGVGLDRLVDALSPKAGGDRP